MLERILPVGTTVRLENDPVSDSVDRYGRQLAYVFVGTKNINVAMVRQGAATPYFYQGEIGKYAPQLRAAVAKAQKERAGIWRSCNVKYDSSRGVDTGPTN
jgi:micrococcal nuclease